MNIKKVTPMHKLSFQFSSLREMLKDQFNDAFNYLNLNGCNPKYKGWFSNKNISTKGVFGDCVQIYKIGYSENSFAFTFMYKDLLEPYILASRCFLKGKEKQYIYSSEFSYDDFKKNLNIFINKFKEKQSFTENEIFSTFSDLFLKEKVEDNTVTKEIIESFNKHNELAKADLQHLKDEEDKLKSNLLKSEKIAEDKILNSKEYFSFKEIEKKYLLAKSKLELKKNSINNSFQIQQQKVNLQKKEKESYSIKHKIEYKLEEKKKDMPFYMRHLIKS